MEILYQPLDGRSRGYYALLTVLLAFVAAGFAATFYLVVHGLHNSGMTNRIPWGLQIVMAIFYIGLSAGSLVVSGLYGIFGKLEYKPFARLAAFLAMLFLVAGLLSIVTDQGRIDRVFVEPFSHVNPSSMFSINPALYMGHIMICIFYLWALFKEKGRLTKVASVVVVLWALCVHTGTGAIFAFTPRELYNTALLPPSFVAAALSSGAALMIIVLTSLFRVTKRHLDMALVIWLGRLLAVFIVVALYVILIENAHRFYQIESREATTYYLFKGYHAWLFWGGLIGVGSVVPAVLLFRRRTGTSVRWIVFASALVVVGVVCERYLIVLPGLEYPPELLPGMEIVRSALDEGIVAYVISPLEILQALGVLSLIGFIFVLGLKYLPLLPTEARAHGESQMLKHLIAEAKAESAEKATGSSV
ncbi:MAG: polysulfide reductase NrfD [bacterium]|nr:polysulfide reductase NrfD [bacterium]